MGTSRRRRRPPRSTARRVPTRSMVDALFPATRQRVLGLLFGQPDRELSMIELIALAGSGRGAVQREVERLVASGLVSCTIAGRQKTYRADSGSPIFSELTGIIAKTAGVAGAVRAALAPLAPRVDLAVLYGSVAKASDRAGSDIDVLLVGDELALEEVFAALESAERQLGRRVSPTLYSRAEFQRRRQANHPFLTKVLGGKHVVLVGSEDAIRSPR